MSVNAACQWSQQNNSFFRKDNDQSIQYSGSTNFKSHASLTQLFFCLIEKKLLVKSKSMYFQRIVKTNIKKKLGLLET